MTTVLSRLTLNKMMLTKHALMIGTVLLKARLGLMWAHV